MVNYFAESLTPEYSSRFTQSSETRDTTDSVPSTSSEETQSSWKKDLLRIIGDSSESTDEICNTAFLWDVKKMLEEPGNQRPNNRAAKTLVENQRCAPQQQQKTKRKCSPVKVEPTVPSGKTKPKGKFSKFVNKVFHRNRVAPVECVTNVKKTGPKTKAPLKTGKSPMKRQATTEKKVIKNGKNPLTARKVSTVPNTNKKAASTPAKQRPAQTANQKLRDVFRNLKKSPTTKKGPAIQANTATGQKKKNATKAKCCKCAQKKIVSRPPFRL